MIKRLVSLVLLIALTVLTVRSSDVDQPQEQGFPSFAKRTNATPITPKKSITSPNNVFKLQRSNIPESILKKGYGKLDGIIYPAGQQYSGKLSIERSRIHDPRTGIFLTQPPIGFMLFRDKPESSFFNRILIDSNLNDTLQDETVIEIADISKRTPVELSFNGKPITFDLQIGGQGLILYPKYWFEGDIKLKEDPYKAAIFKSSYGSDYNYGVVLLVDFNRDGEYTASEFEYKTEAFLLHKQMVLKGKFYDAAISTDGSELKLQRTQGDFGQITFTMPDTAKLYTESYKFSFLPQGGSGRDILKIALEELPITLPVGRYGIIEGLVYNSEYRELLKFACPEFNIVKDKRLRLALNAARMDALARQDGNKLIAAQKTYGPKNIYFNLVGPADPKDSGPELLVYDTDDKKTVYIKDHLEYG